ncbi:WS/DGAT domain-containing protein [Mycobacterium colombiense]|uniref:WS/DGAT domain-containing protein n=1 Tax=Mycobacterium colombiense TaxID=339268 RepID=UPI003D34E574
MALVSGVPRQYLIDRNEMPKSSLVASVPVSVHGKSDRPGRNQVSAMFSSLHTQIDDPVERLKAIAEANSIAKEHSSAIGASLLQDWSQFAAPAVFGIAMRLCARTRCTDSMPVHNLVVSNVPGPQVPLYMLAGGQIDVPVGADFSRLGAQHRRDVAAGQTRRRAGRLPGSGAGPVGDCRRVRGGARRAARAGAVASAAVPLIRISGFLWQHRLAWACLAAPRSRARC